MRNSFQALSLSSLVLLSSAAAGLEIGSGVTIVAQGSSGAPDDAGAAPASVDIEFEEPLSETLGLFLHLEAGPGMGLDLGTLSGLNEDADGDASLRVTEFNLKGATDRLELLCGMLDASAVVDANAFAGEVCEVGFSGSVGLIWQGKTWPEGDAVGFALGVSRRSDEFVENNPGTPDGAELQMELFYRRRVNESFTLLPDLQLVINPGGDEDADPIAVFELRSQVSF